MAIYTNKQHEVHVIVGDAWGIVARAREIERLGDQMIGAAGVLAAIADGATEEKGRSIERIRDEVSDTHSELELAGQRYRPTGGAMRDYGTALSSVQATMRTLVAEIETAHAAYQSKRQDAAEAAEAADESRDYDPTDTVAKSRAETDRWLAREAGYAAGTAKVHLDELLEDYDDAWDTWDAAYDTALGRITGATTGNITDTRWDDWSGIAQIVVNVLSVVGFVVGLAALIIGGPILALIAVVAGVLLLVATIYLYTQGRADGGDLAWAIVGVLPFGRLGALFQPGARMQSLKFLAGPVFDIAEPVGQLLTRRGIVRSVAGLGTGSGLGRVARAGLASRVADTFAGVRWNNVLSMRQIATNIGRGPTGGWSTRIAEEFASYTSHHQRVINTAARGVDDIIREGSTPLHVADMVSNIGDAAVKTYSSSQDAWSSVSDLFGSDEPVDAWREQLAA